MDLGKEAESRSQGARLYRKPEEGGAGHRNAEKHRRTWDKSFLVLGDSIYGQDRKMRRFLEERRQAYILTLSSNVMNKQVLEDWTLSHIAEDRALKSTKGSCDMKKRPKKYSIGYLRLQSRR